MLDKFGDSINIVGTPYLMSRNVDFRTFILQLSYYKNNFQPQKFSLDICYYTNLLVQITLSMVFIKHNYLKSDIFFNPILISCFSGSKFCWVQVFQGPCFSGSRFFRVRGQVLEAAHLKQLQHVHFKWKIFRAHTKTHRYTETKKTFAADFQKEKATESKRLVLTVSSLNN